MLISNDLLIRHAALIRHMLYCSAICSCFFLIMVTKELAVSISPVFSPMTGVYCMAFIFFFIVSSLSGIISAFYNFSHWYYSTLTQTPTASLANTVYAYNHISS